MKAATSWLDPPRFPDRIRDTRLGLQPNSRATPLAWNPPHSMARRSPSPSSRLRTVGSRSSMATDAIRLPGRHNTRAPTSSEFPNRPRNVAERQISDRSRCTAPTGPIRRHPTLSDPPGKLVTGGRRPSRRTRSHPCTSDQLIFYSRRPIRPADRSTIRSPITPSAIPSVRSQFDKEFISPFPGQPEDRPGLRALHSKHRPDHTNGSSLPDFRFSHAANLRRVDLCGVTDVSTNRLNRTDGV